MLAEAQKEVVEARRLKAEAKQMKLKAAKEAKEADAKQKEAAKEIARAAAKLAKACSKAKAQEETARKSVVDTDDEGDSEGDESLEDEDEKPRKVDTKKPGKGKRGRRGQSKNGGGSNFETPKGAPRKKARGDGGDGGQLDLLRRELRMHKEMAELMFQRNMSATISRNFAFNLD
jgi:regulator of protease activity HflC (stomatin/prohibitin superfamily)